MLKDKYLLRQMQVIVRVILLLFCLVKDKELIRFIQINFSLKNNIFFRILVDYNLKT